MNSRNARSTAVSFLLAGAVALTGCATQGTPPPDYGNRISAIEQKVDELGKAKPQAAPAETGGRKASRRSAVPEGYSAATMALPSGDESSSSLLVEKMVPSRVVAGAEYESYLVVTNLTDGVVLQDVVIKDQFANGYTLKSSTPPAAANTEKGATWNLGMLAPGKSAKITMKGSSPQVGEIVCCSTAEYTPVVCISTIAEKPSLALAETGTTSAQVCDELTYSIKVTNNGTGNATNVKVSSNLPAGITTADGKNSVAFDVPVLAAGTSKDFSIKAKAAKTGKYTTSSSATADNGLSAKSAEVATTVCQPMFEVAVKGEDHTYAGRKITFNGSVSNKGDCEVKNAVITMTVPPCTKFASASGDGKLEGNVVKWNVASIAAGAAISPTLTVQADEICVAKTELAAEGVCADKKTASAQTNLLGISAVLLEVIDTADPVRIGEVEDYVVTVTNQGTTKDTNLQIIVELENMEYVSSTGPTAGTAAGNKVTFAPLAQIDPKAKVEWHVKARGTKVGDVRPKFTLTTDELKTRPVQETEATNIYE